MGYTRESVSAETAAFSAAVRVVAEFDNIAAVSDGVVVDFIDDP